MNNKDREALDKFVDEDTLSPEDTKRFAEMSDGERATFIAERFFEAGAKHGRAEMQNAYETLNAHDEMLIATVEKLKEEINTLKDVYDQTIKDNQWEIDYRGTRIKSLRTENTKLIEALKLFAFPESKLEHEDVERVSRQVLKEIGEE